MPPPSRPGAAINLPVQRHLGHQMPQGHSDVTEPAWFGPVATRGQSTGRSPFDSALGFILVLAWSGEQTPPQPPSPQLVCAVRGFVLVSDPQMPAARRRGGGTGEHTQASLDQQSLRIKTGVY